MVTTTARSKRYFEKNGFIVAHVEKFNFYTKRRNDVFGFGDLLVCKPGFGIALVQVTSGSNHSARRIKIGDEPRADVWKKSGGVILLHSWAKRGKRGQRKLWQLSEESL